MKAKACVLERFGSAPEVREFDVAPLAPGEVLVKIDAACVCGSDVHICAGEDPRTPLPIIPGHEGVGRVADVNGAVSDVFGEQLRVGDLVVWERGIFCKTCYYCAVLKRPALCPNRRTYGISVGCAHPPFLQGTYADHIHLRAGTAFIKLSPGDDFEAIAAASCSGATAANTMEQANISPGDSVVVIGPGPLGLFCVAFARACGAGRIMIVGKRYHGLRLELAYQFGADDIICSDDGSPAERLDFIRSRTAGLGANCVIDCAGRPSALAEYLDAVAPGGSYLLPGIAVPAGEWPIKPFESIARKNVRLQGIWVSDTGHLFQAVQLVRSGRFPFRRMITHRFRLDQAAEALRVMADRSAVKAALTP